MLHRRDNYEVIVARKQWPFKEIMESATYEQLNEINQRRNTSAFISIRYATTVQIIRDFEPRFHSVELFICNVGGLISMWIGICMIDLFGILDTAVSRIMKIQI